MVDSALVCGSLLLIGFLLFFINIVMTVGLESLIGIFKPMKNKNKDLLPSNSAA
jgi:hypothetical protein